MVSAPSIPLIHPKQPTRVVEGQLVKHLLQEPECDRPVYVLDHHVDGPNSNRHASEDDDVTYIEGSITDAALVASVLARVRPRVIFHAASPVASLPRSRWSEFEATNVTGTRVLLDSAAASDTVQGFVYTSSPDVYAHPPHHNVTEAHPLVPETQRRGGGGGGVSEYVRTKAAGQRLVLAANDGNIPNGLRTCALLPAHMYGERSAQGLREILDLCAGRDGSRTASSPLVQLGAGDNLMSVASADNVAQAHLLAAEALLDPRRARDGAAVAGESFNITDGRPVAFWNEHVRAVWKEACGAVVDEAEDEDEDSAAAMLEKRVIVVPGWVYRAIAWVVRMLFRVLTLGTVSPPTAVSEQGVLYSLGEHTYSVDKLRDRLGFEPAQDHDGVMRQAVRWELNRRRQQQQKKKGGVRKVE
ncbi:C-3 sterol dehydrogenase/C-4 decarboxylase [Apiospora aurea]|uniref:C-3 sterol dehydrogenase/C-4 decarboxylase n=1 Tax=Apiospora aurea TaxID=335848 RepID=A0ABR1QWY5_9PEZI